MFQPSARLCVEVGEPLQQAHRLNHLQRQNGWTNQATAQKPVASAPSFDLTRNFPTSHRSERCDDYRHEWSPPPPRAVPVDARRRATSPSDMRPVRKKKRDGMVALPRLVEAAASACGPAPPRSRRRSCSSHAVRCEALNWTPLAPLLPAPKKPQDLKTFSGTETKSSAPSPGILRPGRVQVPLGSAAPVPDQQPPEVWAVAQEIEEVPAPEVLRHLGEGKIAPSGSANSDPFFKPWGFGTVKLKITARS